MTHQLLSKYFELESFEDLVKEVDECISPSEFNGRIMNHVIQEIIRDVIPNFCYNNVTDRFLRSSVFYAEPIQRPRMPNPKHMYMYSSKVVRSNSGSLN
jgi:cytoplasmic FMR1 interacting protein